MQSAVTRLAGNQLFLAVQTVAELRYGALVAGRAKQRRTRLEAAIAATTVLPVTDDVINAVARLRYQCPAIGHPLADRTHHGDLGLRPQLSMRTPRWSPPTACSRRSPDSVWASTGLVPPTRFGQVGRWSGARRVARARDPPNCRADMAVPSPRSVSPSLDLDASNPTMKRRARSLVPSWSPTGDRDSGR